MVLEVVGLKTYFPTRRGTVRAVDDVSFAVGPGETLGLVGESGSGKSITALSIVRLVPPPGQIVEGHIYFQGQDLLVASDAQMQAIRGRGIAMILQDPDSSLNPVFAIGTQLAEAVVRVERREAAPIGQRVIDVLKAVRISSPDVRAGQYPHQLSGGMRQRVVTGIGISLRPQLLIADEPTTALDVTLQLQMLGLLKQLQATLGFAMIFITHDLGVVARVCDRVAVMYAGRIVETGAVREVFERPRHPYTIGLLDSIPSAGLGDERLGSITGQPPNPLQLPQGCRFAPRCPHATDQCWAEYPPPIEVADGHIASCWLAGEILR